MKLMMKCFLVIMSFLFSANTMAQKKKIKKAEKQYENLEYINSQRIYLEVVKEGYASAEIFKKLGNTYYFNSDYKNAALWYNRLIQEFPSETETEYFFRAAQSFKSVGKNSEFDLYMRNFYNSPESDSLVQNYQQNITSPDSLKIPKFTIEKTEINSSYADFGPTIYKDKLIFASAMPPPTGEVELHEWNKQPFLDLYQANMDSAGILSNVSRLPGEINTRFHESSTSFTEDGNHVYFTRNNFIDGRKGKDSDQNIRLKIYKATKNEKGWNNIVELPMNDDTFSVAHPALDAEEKRLYFSSDRPGTTGESDLWYVDILGNNKYGQPVNLGSRINTRHRETFPFVSSNNVLFFASNGRNGPGGLDIYYTQLDSQGLPTEIYKMQDPINSIQDDFGFTFNREKNLAFLSSNRDGANESVYDDIYRAIPVCKITLSGTISDADDDEKLSEAEIALFTKNNSQLGEVSTGEDGEFTFNGDCNSFYSLRVTKEGYQPLEHILTTPGQSSNLNLSLSLIRRKCPPKDLGCILTLQPIYFDYDQWRITSDAEIELAKIYAALKEYPELDLHIESHTDSRGSKEYNLFLSNKRAQTTMNWLIYKGIDANRLTSKGYGESQLVNECTDDADCNEEKHRMNRRSVFKIQND